MNKLFTLTVMCFAVFISIDKVNALGYRNDVASLKAPLQTNHPWDPRRTGIPTDIEQADEDMPASEQAQEGQS